MKKCMLTLASFIMLVSMASFAQADWIDRTDPVGSGTITASSQIGSFEGADRAFDNDQYTKWLTNFTTTGWIQYQFADGEGYAISKYTIRSANDSPERSPKDWQLLGSYDGTNWAVIDTQTEVIWTAVFDLKEFICSNNVAYPIYRLDITANGGSDNLLGFSEMELFEDDSAKASNPAPANLAIDVPTTLVLTWDAAIVAPATVLEHKVYVNYGTSDPNLFLVATIPASGDTGSHTITTALNRDSLYQWRVDEITSDATVIVGDVWAFETVLSVPTVNDAYPEDATVWPGENAVLTASASNPFTGDATGLSYAWLKNGTLLTAGESGFSGINSESLTVLVGDPNDGGEFTCTITLDSNGKTTDSRTAIVDVKALVGHWEFEADASDSTSYASNGTLVEDATIATGKIGQALDLDGDGDYVNIPVNYPQKDRVTVTAWVYARTAPTWATIAKNWPGQFHFGLYSTQGRLDFEAGPSTGSSVRVTEDDEFPLEQWQFVAGVADGQKIRMYRNGVEVGDAVDYDGTLNITNQVLAIGCKLDGDVPSSYWDGLIDDVRIYSAALSPTDIADLYLEIEGGSVCIDRPEFDFDMDCKVSLNDFAIFASGWLECNLIPVTACE